jgi:hypothetical protein
MDFNVWRGLHHPTQFLSRYVRSSQRPGVCVRLRMLGRFDVPGLLVLESQVVREVLQWPEGEIPIEAGTPACRAGTQPRPVQTPNQEGVLCFPSRHDQENIGANSLSLALGLSMLSLARGHGLQGEAFRPAVCPRCGRNLGGNRRPQH